MVTVSPEVIEKCKCHACIKEFKITDPVTGWSWDRCVYILCPVCGNKRCPKASDHRNECTGSNEPGQAGSVY